jgi:3-hydroxyacyl-CoA dehydrogenase / enoyl-CoA hydratase / 3-hydroxybutyryl-CoA epimerase
MNAWTYQTRPDGIGVLTLDVPGRSANTLSVAVLNELGEHLGRIEATAPAGLLIRSGKASGFIAGADINEFTQLKSVEEARVMVRRGQGLFDRLAALPCPSVALIQGFALGGGMELALACRYRVGVADDKLALGLPEVQLGIQPGFGGSVRSVRLIGVRSAMDMMLTGKTIRGDKALKLGLVDRYLPAAQAEEGALALLKSRPPTHQPPLLERALSWPLIRQLVKPSILAQVQKKARREHYPAPYAMVDLWAKNGAHGRVAFDDEVESISNLFHTPTARNLVRVFQLQDRLKGLGRGECNIQKVHVVGAGVMGGDIAAWSALRGFNVSLQDRSIDVVNPALKRATELFAKRLRNDTERQETTARLQADVAGENLVQADLVIEAIFENLEAKRSLYAQAESRMPERAILASNTSSIVLESLSEGLHIPARFVGLHFFNPVPQMPLVEIIEGPETSPDTLAVAAAFVRKLDKLPLPCRSAPGFLVNRVLIPYLQEGMLALEQGVSPEAIDLAATNFGMPMGPIELADVVGLDVCKHVGEIIGAAVGRTPPQALNQFEALIAAKHLGRKTGRGFYTWVDGKAQKNPVNHAEVTAELTDRLMLMMTNECVACLRLKIVADADLVDAGVIFGTGFAPFRGGPLQWAKQEGATVLRAKLEALSLQQGSRFTPDPGWSLLEAAAKIH